MTYTLKNILAERPNKKIYLEGDKIIKVFSDAFSTSDVFNEAMNLSCIEDTGIRAPKILEVTKIEGKWALVLDYIKGKTIAQLFAEKKNEHDAILERFVDIQIGMHTHTAPRLPLLADKMQRKILQTNLDGNIRYELHTRLDGLPKHRKLCHGDYQPSNVVINDKDEAYIIDWAHATQGNASADAARTYLLFSLAGEGDTAEKYLNLFCKKSVTTKEYVQKWIPIVSASQYAKGNPGEKEFLQKWASVVEYQ